MVYELGNTGNWRNSVGFRSNFPSSCIKRCSRAAVAPQRSHLTPDDRIEAPFAMWSPTSKKLSLFISLVSSLMTFHFASTRPTKERKTFSDDSPQLCWSVFFSRCLHCWLPFLSFADNYELSSFLLSWASERERREQGKFVWFKRCHTTTTD